MKVICGWYRKDSVSSLRDEIFLMIFSINMPSLRDETFLMIFSINISTYGTKILITY